MSSDFDRRMRRRARVSAVARIVFAIFGVVALGGTAALRFARGCSSMQSLAAEPAPELRIDVGSDGTVHVDGELLDDATLASRLRALAASAPQTRVAIHARDDRSRPVARVVALAMTSGLADTSVLRDPRVP